MEQSEVENIRKEISTKIKLPKEEKQKIYKKMFINLLMALGVLIYFIFLNLGYLRLDTEVFKEDLKMFAIILICFTIYFMEKAYKTNRGTYIVHSIELLVLSLITLYMPYVYFYHNKIAQFLFTTSAVYLAIYYTIKCICMYIIYKNRYIRGASDVKDIIKDEPVSYLDEESSKKFENVETENTIIKDKNIKDKKAKIKFLSKITKKKDSNNLEKENDEKIEEKFVEKEINKKANKKGSATKNETNSKTKKTTKTKTTSRAKKKEENKNENNDVDSKIDEEKLEEKSTTDAKKTSKPKTKRTTKTKTVSKKTAKKNEEVDEKEDKTAKSEEKESSSKKVSTAKKSTSKTTKKKTTTRKATAKDKDKEKTEK